MRAIQFDLQQNVANGDGYLELPFCVVDDVMVTTWKISDEELEEIKKNNNTFQIGLLYNPNVTKGIIPMLVEPVILIKDESQN